MVGEVSESGASWRRKPVNVYGRGDNGELVKRFSAHLHIGPDGEQFVYHDNKLVNVVVEKAGKRGFPRYLIAGDNGAATAATNDVSRISRNYGLSPSDESAFGIVYVPKTESPRHRFTA